MKLINGKEYYPLDEAAALAGISVRTLRRWISAGQLSDFLFPFRAGPNEVLYRLEAPDEGDVQNEKGEWTVSSALKGGASVEGISSS